jgi:hypothetical protein
LLLQDDAEEDLNERRVELLNLCIQEGGNTFPPLHRQFVHINSNTGNYRYEGDILYVEEKKKTLRLYFLTFYKEIELVVFYV